MATMVSPSRVRGTDSSRSSAIATPAAAHESMMALCHPAPSPSSQSRTEAAIVGPTPSVPASASSVASRIALIEPNSVASARAAVGPTWRIDNATSTRHSGTVSLRSWRLASSRRPLALSWDPSSPFFGARVKSGAVSRAASSRSNRAPSLATPPLLTSAPASSSATAASDPSPSMSKAPRPATWKTRSRTWAGHRS